MKILNSNTLIDISKHTDAVIKLAEFIAKSEQKIFYSSLVGIDETTTANDVLLNFDKDMIKTINTYEKIHSLLSTVDKNDKVERLENDQKDLKEIFKEYYNSSDKTIQLPEIKLELLKSFDKEEAKDTLSTALIGVSYKEFKKLLRKIDDIYKIDKDTIQNEEDSIYYLSLYGERKKYEVIVDAIKNLVGEFSDYRQSTSNVNKSLIDNQITMNRSMIDSVIQNSTYMSKEEGLVQLATSHKKNFKVIESIYEKHIKKGNLLSALEIDPDVSIEAISSILDQLEDEVKLNINKKFVLKFRKLGNYNANGLYIHKFNIVACDIKEPSALIHELTHLVDLSNSEIQNEPFRQYIVNKYKDLCDINLMNDFQQKKAKYYFNDDEIIARLGEISYLLKKYDYNGEEANVFFENVKLEQDKEEGKIFRLVKKIDFYIENSAIYFDFKELKKENLVELKNYYDSYFSKTNENIKDLSYMRDNRDKKYKKKEKREKTINIFKNSIYASFNEQFIKGSLDLNKKDPVIEFETLFKYICRDLKYLSRTEKKINIDDLNKQLNTLHAIAEWTAEQNDNKFKVDFLKNLYLLSTLSNDMIKITTNVNRDYEGSDLEELHFKNIEEIKEQKEISKGKSFLNHRGLAILYPEIERSMKTIIKSFQNTSEILKQLKESDTLTYAIFADGTVKTLIKENLDQNVFDKSYNEYIKENLKELDKIGALELIFINKNECINIIKDELDFLGLDYNTLTYQEIKKTINPNNPEIAETKEVELVNKKTSKKHKKDDRQLNLF